MQVNSTLSLDEPGETGSGQDLLPSQDASPTATTTTIEPQSIRFGCFNIKGEKTQVDITVFKKAMEQLPDLDIIALQELRWVEASVANRLHGLGPPRSPYKYKYCGNKAAGVLYQHQKFTAKKFTHSTTRLSPDLRDRVVCVVLTAIKGDPPYELFVVSVHAPRTRFNKKERSNHVGNILTYASAMAAAYEAKATRDVHPLPALPALPIIVAADFNTRLDATRVPYGWGYIEYAPSARRAARGVIDHVLLLSNETTWPTVQISDCVSLDLTTVIQEGEEGMKSFAIMTNHDPISAQIHLTFQLCAIENCAGPGRVAGYHLECEGCKKLACIACFAECPRCNDTIFCRLCLRKETKCGAKVCKECWWECGSCDGPAFCKNSGDPPCDCESSTDCSVCNDMLLCDSCRESCGDCDDDEWFCGGCMQEHECGKAFDARDSNASDSDGSGYVAYEQVRGSELDDFEDEFEFHSHAQGDEAITDGMGMLRF